MTFGIEEFIVDTPLHVPLGSRVGFDLTNLSPAELEAHRPSVIFEGSRLVPIRGVRNVTPLVCRCELRGESCADSPIPGAPLPPHQPRVVPLLSLRFDRSLCSRAEASISHLPSCFCADSFPAQISAYKLSSRIPSRTAACLGLNCFDFIIHSPTILPLLLRGTLSLSA